MASATTPWPCLSAADGGSRLAVSVSPNARRTAVDGLHDGALRVRLAARPVDGQANASLLAWLADQLGCARRSVQLLRGDAARHKLLHIALPPEQVGAWLQQQGLPPGAG